MSDSTASSFSLQPGRRVLSRFSLVRLLGRGGMGSVWLARDEQLAEEVALKFLPEAVHWDPAALAELRAETRRARSLTHPNIVRVHDLEDDGIVAALAMEFVDGQSLAQARLARPDGITTADDIRAWLPPIAAAIDYAHREGRIVHRDLKPANILLARDGTLKVVDFGISRSLSDTLTRQTAGTAGTLAYMSPQQQVGEPPTPADDIYSLGATLYDLLAGRPPFYTGNIIAQIHGRRPDSIAGRRRALGFSPAPPLPPGWEGTIAACLAKDPAARPATAGEVARLLAAGDGTRSSAPSDPAAPGRRRHRRKLLAGAGAVALALLATGLARTWREKSSTAVPTSPQPQATPLREFVEDFDPGLAGWVKWGEPLPRVIEAFQGRRGIFDNMGDGMHDSGITSVARFSSPGGCVLESEVFLHVTNPAGYHLGAGIGLSRDADNWMDPPGALGDNGLGAGLSLTYANGWGFPEELRRRAIVNAVFLDEDGNGTGLGEQEDLEQLFVSQALNRWVRLRIIIDAERKITFWLDDRLVWAPAKKVHPRVLAQQRIVVRGRSAGSAGKAYHHWVRLAAASPGQPLTSIAGEARWLPKFSRLPWGAATWSGLSARVGAPAEDGTLSIAGEDTALTSVGQFSGRVVLTFELQPLLQSAIDGSDRLRIGFRSGPREVALEFAHGEIWLVDTRNPDARTMRVGTYLPGQWSGFAFHGGPDGRFEAAGSQARGIVYSASIALPQPWRVVIETSGTADGALLRPLGVSERRGPEPVRW